MNVVLCVAWFIFGFIVGQLLLIGIALVMHDIKENKDGKNNNYKSE